MMEINKCPICNSTEIIPYFSTRDYFFTNEEFSISKCNSCNFIFTNPVPAKEEIAKYYNTDKYISHDTNSNGLLGKLYNTIRDFNLKNKYSIIKKYIQQGSALDIGSGTGEFLNFLKNKNWKTHGIEPEKKAREFAINKYKLEIFDENKLNQLNKNEFDLISMWHVLEHVYEINERLQIIHSLLKDDGIFINALPMIDSLDSLRFGKYWAGLDVPRHLHHFSHDTFQLLANNCGFELIDKYPLKFDSYYVSYLSHKALNNSLALIRGLADGCISNMKADSKRNYSSMIFVLRKK